MEEALYAVLDGALIGAHVAAGAPAVLNILACAAAEGRHRGSLEGLSAAQIVRAILHAAATCKQAQAVLLDIQSAAVLYPAIVPLLLQALRSEQRQHLQETLIDLAQQQQHLLRLELQQQALGPEHKDAQCPAQYMQQQQTSDQYLSDRPTSADAASAADAQLQPWVLQLSELGIWDVLLLLGLCGDPQWEADASVVLLTAVNSMHSLQQISDLFQDLSAVSDGAAEWLLSVGVRWATTCYLDMEVDGPSFEQAGLRLLEGGVWSTQQLAQQGMQQLLQHLKAEADCKSPLWQVLQSLVSRCIHCIHTEQQLANNHRQQQRPCNLGAFRANSRQQVADPGCADMAAVCVEQLLTGLPEMLKPSKATLAKQYILTLEPLVAYSCDVAHALLAAARLQLGCQTLSDVDAHCQFTPQQLMIKQELLESDQLRNATAEAAATVTALAGSIADRPTSRRSGTADTIAVCAARSAGVVGHEVSVSGELQQPALLPDGSESLQQQQEDPQQQVRSNVRQRQRYSWGSAGNNSKSDNIPSSAVKELQQSPSTFAMPLGNATADAAQPCIAATPDAVDNSTRFVRGDLGRPTPMNANQSPLPFLSPAVTLSPALGAVTIAQLSQDASAPAAIAASVAQHIPQQQHQQCKCVGNQYQPPNRLQLFDVAASQQMLARLLQRVAGDAAVSCHLTQLNTQSRALLQHSMASSLLEHAALPQAEEVIVALIGAVLQNGTPCSGTCRQQQLATVLQLTLQLSPAALQHVCKARNSSMQHGLQQQEADSGVPDGCHAYSTPLGFNNSFAVDTDSPAAAAPSGSNNSIAGSKPADSDTHWAMCDMWQQLLQQLLQHQVCQLAIAQAGQQPTAQLCRQQTDVSEHDQLDQSTENSVVSLPIILSAFLDSLSQQTASTVTNVTADQANVCGDQQQLQELQDGSYQGNPYGSQTHLGPGVADLLGQLVSKLLTGWGMSAQHAGSGGDGVGSVEPQDHRSCAAVVRNLLLSYHALSHLLAWMLQHPAASQQILRALAAAETGDAQGGVFAAGLAAQQGLVDSCAVGCKDVAGDAAAADAAVEVEGSDCTAIGTNASQQQQSMEEQLAQQQCRQLHKPASASTAVVPAAGSEDPLYPDVMKRMAVQLQHMAAVLLPTALQHLLAAQESFKAAHTQQQRQAATQSGTVTPAAVGDSKGLSQMTGQTKQKRQSCQFFVVRTPADMTPNASQAQPQQAAAGPVTAATAVAAAAEEEADCEQLLPRHLLQLPILPLSAFQELLSLALSQLKSVASQLHLHQQQRRLSVSGTDKENGSGRAKRSNRSAAAGLAQHVPRGSASSVSRQSSQQLQGSTEEEEAALVAHSGILSASQDALCNNHDTVSPVSCSLQQQETLQLIDLAVASVLAWQRGKDSRLRSDTASLAIPSAAAATSAAYCSSIKLLQLQQQLCAVSTLLKQPAGVGNNFTEVPITIQQQQVEALGCAALSAAAQLMEYWWTAAVAAQQPTNNATATVATASSDGNSVAQQQQRRQQLEKYAKVLRASLAVIHFGDSAAVETAATSRTDGSISWSNVSLVFGHNMGSVSWSAMKRLQQQETLLAASLDLLIKIHHLVQAHQQEHQHEQHYSEAEASMNSSVHPSRLLTALLQQLAMLNAAADSIYNPTGVGDAVSTVGDARWLHKLLVSKAQELVLGQALSPDLIEHPDAARALVKLAQPSYLRTLTSKPPGPPSSATEPCPLRLSPAFSKTLALSAHLMCMHHSPRVYAAAETSIWGRQGLAIGRGAGPGWVVGCSRVAVAAAARMMLQLLLQECASVQGKILSQERLQQGSAAWQEHDVAAAGPDSGAAGAAVVDNGDDHLWLPTRQLVQLWQGRTAATAALLDCCELLLYHRSLHTKHCHQQKQQGALAAGSNRIRKIGTKTVGSGSSNSSGSNSSADVDDDGTVDGTADLQLLLGALAAALAGPCTAAVEQMFCLLQWRIQQQQGGAAGQPAVANAGAAGAALQETSAAAAGPGVTQVMMQGQKPLSKKQLKRATAAAGADPGVLLQAQLSMLLGLGCAAGKMVLSKSSQLLQVLQQQQQALVLPPHKIGAKAAVQQLMQSLRVFSGAYEHLLQALNSAAAGEWAADAGSSVAAGIATAISQLLEPAAEKCFAQSRKEAWAAVTAAAAVLEDSSSDESDDDDDPEDLSADDVSSGKHRDSAANMGPADTADPAARFYDPEVHEELPCGEVSENGSDESSEREPDTEELGTSDDRAGESQQLCTQAGGMAAPQAVDRSQLQSVMLLRAAFSSPQHSGKVRQDSQTTAQQQQQMVAARPENTQPPLQQRPAAVQKLGTAAAAVAAAFPAARARSRPQQQKQPAQLAEPCITPRPVTAGTTKHTSASRRELPAATALPTTPAATAPRQHQQQLVPVVCGNQHATFDPSSSRINLPDGSVVTPSAFEKLGGKGTCKKWRKSIHVVAADGAQGKALGRWLSNPSTACATPAEQPDDLGLGNSNRKRKLSVGEGAAVAGGLTDAAEPVDDVLGVPRLSKKNRISPRGAEAPLHAAQQLQQPQQSTRGKRVVPVPVMSAELHKQQQRSGSRKHLSSQSTSTAAHQQQVQSAGQQQGDPAVSSGDEARARNAFVQACLAEGRVPSYSSDEESEDDSDYSDLEDFIVVQPGKDYRQVCAEAGGKLTWKHRWQQAPGAGVRRE